MLGAVALTPLALAMLAVGGLPRAGAASWAAVLFLAVVTSIAGYVGWYWALARGGIARVAPLQFLQPLSGLLLAALLLGERLTWPLAVGAAVVITGVAIARRP
jgi:drug/metabolite transporter (DMT)-like permease